MHEQKKALNYVLGQISEERKVEFILDKSMEFMKIHDYRKSSHLRYSQHVS